MISTCPMSSVHPLQSEVSSHGRWEVDNLLLAAKKARENAFVPLSRFRVGAAVLSTGGRIYEGCNTECLIPVLGVCAERNALNHAIVHGDTGFIAIAVVSDLNAPLLPCGTCLQYLQEFARQEGRDILIIAEGCRGDRVVTSVDDLFKGGFPPDTSVKEIQESFRWTSQE